MIYGIDALAGAKYGRVIRTIPNDFALGIFAETFGDAFPVVKQALADGRPIVRIHLLWSDSHSYGDRDIKKIKALSTKYAPLAEQYPGKVWISPFCEHKIAKPGKYLDLVREYAPKAVVVNTPWTGGLSPTYINEVHGDHKLPPDQYVYSYDGTNAVDENVTADKERHASANAQVFFIWHPRLNLKWSMKDSTPRPQRKALPTREMMASLTYLATDKGQTKVPRNWLIKSHSEKHDAADRKGDKLLIISPVKAKQIDLQKNGKKVGSLSYYGTFSGGGYRYYAPKWGYQYGSGLSVVIEGKSYGTINGGFRDGSYR